MLYAIPVVGEFNFKPVAFSQSVATVTNVGFTSAACLSFEYNGNLPQGIFEVLSHFNLTAGSSCQISGDITVQAQVSGQTITSNCDTLVLSCSINSTCTAPPTEAGTISIISATVNNIPLDGLPIDETLDSALIHDLFDYVLSHPVCDTA